MNIKTYSTVTVLAKFQGLSGSRFLILQISATKSYIG